MLAVGNVKTINPELGKPYEPDIAYVDISIQFVFEVFFCFVTYKLLSRSGLEQQKKQKRESAYYEQKP